MRLLNAIFLNLKTLDETQYTFLIQYDKIKNVPSSFMLTGTRLRKLPPNTQQYTLAVQKCLHCRVLEVAHDCFLSVTQFNYQFRLLCISDGSIITKLHLFESIYRWINYKLKQQCSD